MTKLRTLGVALTVAIAALLSAGPATAAPGDVPTPAVTGPIPVSGDSYPFLATDINLSEYGYVEEEFFIEGDGYRYDTSGPSDQTATRIESGGPNGDGTYPFKTRIVVRRPANPADANGKVVAEWNNVTATQDIEWNWFGDPFHLLENGYTFVGVTAQNTGVNSLKAFNGDRYGDLTVNGNGTVPSGPGLDGDALSYDVFSAALKAVSGGGTGADSMGGINSDLLIASGESQSCGRLATHYNEIQPIHEIADAYLLTVCSSQLRTDRPEKAIRIISETENRTPRPESTYPDTGSLRHWEVAASSHLPRMAFDNINPVLTRDFLSLTVECEKFPLSLIQWPFTQNRAIDGLVEWAQGGQAPPIAPRGEYVANPDFNPGLPPSFSNPEQVLRRDQSGIAFGGIRYPDVTVPTAVNDGINSAGEGGSIFSLFCRLLGSTTPFAEDQLHALYGDYADYVNQYADAADDFLTTDFILPSDVDRLKAMSRDFPGLRPAKPMLVGKKKSRGRVGLTWVGTEAADTSFLLQRRASGKRSAWKTAMADTPENTVTLKKQPQGTHRYRVRSSTVIPATNISEESVTTTPFSEKLARVKVDRSGPKKPRIRIRGKRAGGKGVYRGRVRVKVIGRPDRKLPDGSRGVGLRKKSVPKVKRIKKKGRTVIKVRTRDKLGNKSKRARKVIRIKR